MKAFPPWIGAQFQGLGKKPLPRARGRGRGGETGGAPVRKQPLSYFGKNHTFKRNIFYQRPFKATGPSH